MNVQRFFPTALVYLALATQCDSYPQYAGTCATGKSVGNGSHGSTGKGSLDNGNLMISLENDMTMEFKLSDQTTTILDTTSYSVSLKGELNDNISFRGFLIRLEASSGQNIDTALTPASSNVQPMPTFISCGSGVEALTHNNANDKTSTTFDLNFDEPGNYLFEVTVVLSNKPRGSNEWHYSSYNIEVESLTPAPIRSPSKGPSQHPSVSSSVNPTVTSSTAPSEASNIESSFAPSGVPSNMSSQDYTAIPSDSSSMSPSDSSSMSPSDSSSMSPSDSSSMSPSDSSSMSPNDSPSTSPNAVLTQVPSVPPSKSQTPTDSVAPSLSPSVSHVPTFSQVPTLLASTNTAMRLTTVGSSIILVNIVIFELMVIF